MKEVGHVLQDVNVVAFCVLAVACVRQGQKRTDACIRSATLAFGALAVVSVVGLFVRSAPTTPLVGLSIRVILVVLVLLPLFLYRFATAFQPPRRFVQVTAYLSTGLVVLASLGLPYVPRPGSPEPGWWTAYCIGLVAQWTLLFSIVATRLWVAARSEAAVVRSRMRTLALAATGMTGPEEFAMIESLGVFADIVMDRCALADRQRSAEAALAYQASHDRLTGLPNRVLLEDRVAQALARCGGDESRVAVLFLDVDRFKVVNDSLGHAVGDQLLRALAERLQTTMRPEDTIARFGGDEFVIVTEDWATTDAPALLAGRIGASLELPLQVGDTELVATVSIGVAVASAGHDPGSLLRDADAAMYQAKEQGRDRWVLFDTAMREAATQRLETENALRRALDRGELRVHYQPLVEIVSGRITSVEALVRWAQDDETLILPKDFIPVARRRGSSSSSAPPSCAKPAARSRPGGVRSTA